MTREELLDFDARAAFVQFVAERAGLHPRQGERQTWQVGGHELTVEFRRDKTREIVYLLVRDGWPLRPLRRSLCLAELYAITLTGTLREFNKTEQGWFKVRAILDAGLHPTPDMELATLPEDASAAERETWQVVREVAEVREAQGRPVDEPMPLSAPWLARLNGSDENVLRAGKYALEKRAYITRGKTKPSKRGGRPLQLWQVKRDREENE